MRKLRIHRILAAIAILAGAVLLVRDAVAQQGFRLVAHPAVSQSYVLKNEASDYFLKKDTDWGDGTAVLPVDLTVKEIQEAFSDQVHGRSRSSIKKYWQRQIFTGRGTPPPERASDREVLDFVSQTPGAIGYVSTDARINGNEVKVLELR
jgi:hypothetical protein